MSDTEKIHLFGDKRERIVWDDGAEKWYFSVVDVVAVLTDSKNPALYWRVLKNRLKDCRITKRERYNKQLYHQKSSRQTGAQAAIVLYW